MRTATAFGPRERPASCRRATSSCGASPLRLARVQALTTPDGRTLTVREGGDAGGVPVFYLHGTPGSSLLYEPSVAHARSHGIRLISYDRPGFGGSTRKPGRTVGDCAD